MEHRVTVLEHKGRKIVQTDLSNRTGKDLVDQCNINTDHIMTIVSGKSDGLLLVDVTSCIASTDAVNALRFAAARLKPFISKSAIIGLTKIQMILLNSINMATGLGAKPFETKLQAMDWLVS